MEYVYERESVCVCKDEVNEGATGAFCDHTLEDV